MFLGYIKTIAYKRTCMKFMEQEIFDIHDIFDNTTN